MRKSANICAVITEETLSAAINAIHRANHDADMIELRLDYLCDFDFINISGLKIFFDEITLPTIITCRAIEEGGRQKINPEVRLPLLVEGAKQFGCFCDIEAAFYEEAKKLSPDPSKLILSYHNFDETPKNLVAIYDRLIKLPASIHKIATRPGSLGDSLPTFQLLERARKDPRDVIVISMNEPGVITRILGGAHGSFLTYGSLSKSRESAPGQITCDDLRNLYRYHQLTPDTAITGIIGNPVHHSVSPRMHNRAFAALGVDFVYLPIQVSDLDEFFRRFVHPASRELEWNLRGFSVTIPHKVAAIDFLDEVDKKAAKIGAVNTVVIKEQKLVGYNTDVDGAILPLEKLGLLGDRHCAVLGAGGAARAVIFGLLERGARVTVYARDLKRAQTLANEFEVQVMPFEAIENNEANILINTTPVGMHGHSEHESPLPPAALKNCEVVYDLVYNPLDTRLLRMAAEAGLQTISGLNMLVAQAVLQFELWTGHKPDFELMRAAALEGLQL
jgi:3-dehydroquinate dehydratase/shikimate dehydrogenase